MFDLLFNGFLFFMVAIWIIGLVKHRSLAGFTGSLKRHSRRLVPILVWALFIGLCMSYVVWFSEFSDMHDIPEAVDSAVVDFTHGGNPYVDKVVPRFDTKYGENTKVDNWTYNYLPVDLLVYTGLHGAFGILGSPLWFVVSNLLLWTAAFAVFYESVPIKLRGYIPFAGTCAIFYSFDNAALTALLIVGSVYCLKKLRPGRAEVASIILMGLAVMTKAFAVVPFIVLLLWLMEDRLRVRNFVQSTKVALAAVSAACIGLAIMLPFGVLNVLNSAVFFHMSTENRAGTSVGGTVLAELAMGSPYFAYVAVAIVAIAVLACFKFHSLNDRIILASVAFSLISIKSSLALLIVPALFLVLRVREWTAVEDTRPEGLPLTTVEVESAFSSSK